MSLRAGLLLASLLASPLIGCGAKQTEVRAQQRLEGRYRLGSLPSGWESQRAGGADNAWFNAALSSTIYTDSNCARRFQDSPLDDLATHLIAGIATGPPLREDTLTLDNRTALLRVYSGRMDGVRLRIGLVVLNKNRCTYDMLYLAPASTFETGWADFVSLISGFDTAEIE